VTGLILFGRDGMYYIYLTKNWELPLPQSKILENNRQTPCNGGLSIGLNGRDSYDQPLGSEENRSITGLHWYLTVPALGFMRTPVHALNLRRAILVIGDTALNWCRKIQGQKNRWCPPRYNIA